MKTRAVRAALVFLKGLVTSTEIPMTVTVEASKLVTKLERECKANGVKLTKRRRRRKRAVASETVEASS
jgi:transposase-like protein